MRVFNLSEGEKEVTFNFMEKGEVFTKAYTIAGKGIMNANDALQQIFGLNENYGSVLAYSSVVDNLTGDAIYVVGQ